MSIDVMKQALEALERGETRLRYAAITALRAAIKEKAGEEEQETVYDTGGFELEARFYSTAELREMIQALDAMNASVRRMMGETHD